MTPCEIAEIISSLSGDNITVAIDGRCAAGKTTLAKKLSEHLDCNIIHTDHFFLPMEMRTPERLSEPGGNIHYERLKTEVIDTAAAGKPICYGIFSCKEMKVTHRLTLPKKRINIIEGAYSMHPYLSAKYDLSLFLHVTPEEQKNRITERNGVENLDSFITKWVPMEERYIHYYNIEEKCKIFLDFSKTV